MGTRNLTAVVKNGEFKVAQYGQWDGYISGTGSNILEYLHNWDRQKFEDNLNRVVFVDDARGDAMLNGSIHERELMTRDTGCRILPIIENSSLPLIELYDQSSFAEDSLFCEYAYVIDLDTNVFEVYVGFQKAPHDKGRFADKHSVERTEINDTTYYPVRLILSYSLNELPTMEKFMSDARKIEGDE